MDFLSAWLLRLFWENKVLRKSMRLHYKPWMSLVIVKYDSAGI
jgi:hypothetical protein